MTVKLLGATPSGSTDGATKGYVDGLLAASMEYRGAFSTLSPYALNDVVSYLGKFYVCTSPVVLGATTFVGASTQLGLPAGGTIPLPTGSAVGDLVIITISDYTGGGSTKPTYATAVATAANSVNQLNVSSYVLASGDISAGTLTIPAQSGPSTVAMLHGFRNAGRGVDGTAVATTATLSTAAVTPVDGCFLLEICAQVNSTGTGLITAGWSPSGYVNVSAGGVNTADAAGGYETLAAGTTSTVRTFTNPSNTGNVTTAVVPILQTTSAFNPSNWTLLSDPVDAAPGNQVMLAAFFR